MKCHQCIRIDCSANSANLCDLRYEFVAKKLSDVYYPGRHAAICPEPEDVDGWSNLAADTENCPEEKAGEAFCVMGRLRVTSFVYDSNQNITVYGTSLGCARRRLVDLAASSIRINKCSVLEGYSERKDSLSHRIEAEHCATNDVMCQYQDFCINHYQTDVRVFQDDATQTPSNMTGLALVLGVLILAVLVGLFFFLGIKYG